MDEALKAALDLLDKGAAIIQELVAQLQAKSQEKDMTKKAESLALKTGISLERASGMIKEAEEKGEDSDVLLRAAELLKKEKDTSFGKVASEENHIQPTGSKAIDKYLEKEAELLSELEIN